MKIEMKKIILVIAVGILAFLGAFGAEQTGNEIPKFKIIEVINSNVKVPLKVIINEGVSDVAGEIEITEIRFARPDRTTFYSNGTEVYTIQLVLMGRVYRTLEHQKINWAGPNAKVEWKLPKPLEGSIKITLERDSIVKDKLVITITGSKLPKL